MEVLIIVGMPRSGSSTAAKVARDLGIFTISMDDIIREEIMRRALPNTERTYREMREWFHEYGRERELMRRIVDKIINAKNPERIVIEGFTTPEQINELKKRLWGERIYILAIHSPPKIRWEREKTMVAEKPYRFVKMRDRLELSRGLGHLVAMADYIIVNDGSLEEFKERVKHKLIEILNITKEVKP